MRSVFSIICAVVLLALSFVVGVVPAKAADVTSTGDQIQVHVQSDIPYRAPWSSDQTQRLDLYTASSTDTNAIQEAHPVVLFLHGGSWVHGDKNLSDHMPLVKVFLEKGYYVASVNYRLTEESPWPAQINDCKSAVRFLRSNADIYNIDSDNIFVFGESAGAHLALMMAVTHGDRFVVNTDGNGKVASDVQAVISDYGISDVDQWGSLPGDAVADARYAKSLLLGVGYTDRQAAQASPITYASSDAAPILLVHGKNDQVVSYLQSVEMERALRNSGAAKVSSWYPDYGPHSSHDVFVQNTYALQLYLDFLDKAGSTKNDASSSVSTMYRLYNQETETHLFSNDTNELIVLQQSWTGWRNEGSDFTVFSQTVEDSRKVVRLHNGEKKDYLYTEDNAEIAELKTRGWAVESVFYAPISGQVAVYRLYDPIHDRHTLTSDLQESNALTERGWRYEGVAFYALPRNYVTDNR